MILIKKNSINTVLVCLFLGVSLGVSVSVQAGDHKPDRAMENKATDVQAGHLAIIVNLIDDRQVSKLQGSLVAQQYDFTSVIKVGVSQPIIGIIGRNYQRLKMDITQVQPDLNALGRYIVTGVSQVKGNICDFDGVLTLDSVYLYGDIDYGVDNEYQDSGIHQQGFAVFNYQLNENPEQKYSGEFVGKLYAKWYVTDDGKVHYDDINDYSDSYFNNLYYGTWSEYGKISTKIATWANYKLPYEVAPDLNIGAGEFSPNPKYFKYGWSDYR